MTKRNALVFMMLSLVGLGQEVFYQDFEQEPNWQSTRPDLVYWAGQDGHYYTRVQDDGTQYYGISPPFSVVENSSFEFTFDVNPVVTGWGTYPNLILKHESEGLHRTRENRTNQLLWDIRFEVHWDDSNYNKFIMIFTMDGTQYLLPISPTFQRNTWYRHLLAYDVDSETLSWTVTFRDSGLVFHQGTFEGCRIGAFNQMVVGHQGVAPHYGLGRWCTTLFDNLRVVRSAPDKEDVSNALLSVMDQISLLDPASFKNKNRAAVLIKKIDVVLGLMLDDDLESALDKLVNDILGKLDGCAVSGEPDGGDWIIDCPAQGLVYPQLQAAATLLNDLI